MTPIPSILGVAVGALGTDNRMAEAAAEFLCGLWELPEAFGGASYYAAIFTEHHQRCK